MAATVENAGDVLAKAKNKWGTAKGPITATLLSANRLGWKFTKHDTLQTDTGELLDLTVDSPAFVMQQVTEAVRRYIAKEVDDQYPTLESGGRGPIVSGFR